MLDFNVAPYYDDFDATNGALVNNYMRILFKPGYAVQARELTQTQSILQNQIKSFADNIFKNGTPVSGGHLTYDTNVISLQLSPTQANTPISLNDFNGALITNANTTVLQKAVVVTVDDSLQSNTSAGAIVVKYLTGIQFALGDTITTANPSGIQYSATLLSSNTVATGNLAISSGSVVSINPGIFYVNGFFINVPTQTIVLDSQDTYPSYRIGLQVAEGVVNYSTDSALLDPAQGSFNYQAPGADRYQYNLVLSKRSLSSIDDSSFFELMRIENGVITSQVDYPLYGQIGDQMARTVYDQSGDFTISPFLLTIKDNTVYFPNGVADAANTNTYIMSLSSGKAYIKGYEFHTLGAVSMTNQKSRTSNNSVDYNLALDFGNYVIVNNVHVGNTSANATLNIAGYTAFDLHCVPSANINTKNQIAYYSNTVIGTAKLRDIEYAGYGISTTTYYAYLLDVNVSGLSGNANGNITAFPGRDASNTNMIVLPTTFPNTANYVGKIISVIAGNCSGDIKTISAYDSVNSIATISTFFSQLPDSSTKFSIPFSVGDVSSLAVTPAYFAANGIISPNVTGNVFATQNAKSSLYPVLDIDITGRQPVLANGRTTLYESSINTLIYELPQSYVVQNSIQDVSFYSRKFISNVAFNAAGNADISNTFSATETVSFGYTNAYIPDLVANTNVMVVVRNNTGSSLFSNGSIISWDRGSTGGSDSSNGVYETGPQALTLHCAHTGAGSNAFYGDVILTVKENAGTTASRRAKYAYGNTSNTTLATTDVPTNGTAIVGSANTKGNIVPNSVFLDAANGYVWFTNTSVIFKSAGSVQSLYVPDVTQIIKIYDSGNPSYAPNVSNTLVDVTSSYNFFSNQKDSYYDHSYISLKSGYPTPQGQIVVMFKYYNHASTTGFFTANSYPSSDYASGLIPYYSSASAGTVALRDSIDFRPTRANGVAANVQSYSFQGSMTPNPNNPMVLTYSYYLPRIDKLVLTKNKQFRIISGVPSTRPLAPDDASDAMTLYQIYNPSYTDNINNILKTYIDHRRYTMKDIGSLDNRITQLEYYVTLTQQQQQAVNQTVTYTDGSTAKSTYGVVTDSFTDFSIADNGSSDVTCFINGGTLKPFHHKTTLGFNFANASGPYLLNSKTYSLSYQEIPAIVQNTYTGNATVQPYGFGQFVGEMSLTPHSDYYYSTALVPQYVTPVVPAPPPPPPPPPVIINVYYPPPPPPPPPPPGPPVPVYVPVPTPVPVPVPVPVLVTSPPTPPPSNPPTPPILLVPPPNIPPPPTPIISPSADNEATENPSQPDNDTATTPPTGAVIVPMVPAGNGTGAVPSPAPPIPPPPPPAPATPVITLTGGGGGSGFSTTTGVKAK